MMAITSVAGGTPPSTSSSPTASVGSAFSLWRQMPATALTTAGISYGVHIIRKGADAHELA
jgi:hypothetical protein